jgi:hypothetical protein
LLRPKPSRIESRREHIPASSAATESPCADR